MNVQDYIMLRHTRKCYAHPHTLTNRHTHTTSLFNDVEYFFHAMSGVTQIQQWTVMVRQRNNGGFPLLLPVSNASDFAHNKVPFVYAKGSEAVVRGYFQQHYPDMEVHLTPSCALPFYDLSTMN